MFAMHTGTGGSIPRDGPTGDGPHRASRDGPPERPVVRIEDLMDGQHELTILHAGEEYRLRITKNGKLILTK